MLLEDVVILAVAAIGLCGLAETVRFARKVGAVNFLAVFGLMTAGIYFAMKANGFMHSGEFLFELGQVTALLIGLVLLLAAGFGIAALARAATRLVRRTG